jgi:hypothetical protein
MRTDYLGCIKVMSKSKFPLDSLVCYGIINIGKPGSVIPRSSKMLSVMETSLVFKISRAKVNDSCAHQPLSHLLTIES